MCPVLPASRVSEHTPSNQTFVLGALILALCACGNDDGAAPATGGAGGTGGTGARPPDGGGAAGVDSGASGASGAGTGGSTPDGSGGTAGQTWSSEPIASPPSYLGTLNGAGGCTERYVTVGFRPVDPAGGRHPLFLYFVGTAFSPTDPSATHLAEAPRVVTEAMARRGFVALAVQYDNGALAWLSDHESQLACLFGAANAESLTAAACALPDVDCAQGIATWGHSQGGLVADLAANHDPRVRAAWTTGYGGDPRATLPRDRMRVVNGEADLGANAMVATLNQITGLSTTECPDDGRSECLRPDGSGWIIVRRADCQSSSADHCWFDRPSCLDPQVALEPSWVDPTSPKPFALERNADWLALAATLP